MCGRYATTRSEADLSDLFEAIDVTEDLRPSWNVAPTDPVPIIRVSLSHDARVLDTARWGLVPPWATDTRGAARMINARSETVATSPAFAPSFARRRCLVPADGWFEWLRDGKRKQAYYMTPADGSALAFAGIWSPWGPESLITCSVLTTAATGHLKRVHDRMPLILPRDRWAAWLGDESLTGAAAPGAGAGVGAGSHRAGDGGEGSRDGVARGGGADYRGAGGRGGREGGGDHRGAGDGGEGSRDGVARGGGADYRGAGGRGGREGGGDHRGAGDGGAGGRVEREGSVSGRGEGWGGREGGEGRRGASGGDLAELLRPMTERELEAIELRPVGPAVGNVRNNGPHLLEPPAEAKLF